MGFNMAIHGRNRAFAKAVREAFDRAEPGPKKDAAQKHLRAADIAELGGNEVVWALETDWAARALA